MNVCFEFQGKFYAPDGTAADNTKGVRIVVLSGQLHAGNKDSMSIREFLRQAGTIEDKDGFSCFCVFPTVDGIIGIHIEEDTQAVRMFNEEEIERLQEWHNKPVTIDMVLIEKVFRYQSREGVLSKLKGLDEDAGYLYALKFSAIFLGVAFCVFALGWILNGAGDWKVARMQSYARAFKQQVEKEVQTKAGSVIASLNQNDYQKLSKVILENGFLNVRQYTLDKDKTMVTGDLEFGIGKDYLEKFGKVTPDGKQYRIEIEKTR